MTAVKHTPKDLKPTNNPNRWQPPEEERFYNHRETRECHCGEMIEWEADFLAWWIPYPSGNPEPNTFTCQSVMTCRDCGAGPLQNTNMGWCIEYLDQRNGELCASWYCDAKTSLSRHRPSEVTDEEVSRALSSIQEAIK